VGKRRLEKALAQLPEVAAEIHWLPFLLDPTIPEAGMDREAYLVRKFGAEGANYVNERVRAAGADEGIPFAFEKIKRSPNTMDSHRLIQWADEEGKQNAVAERLFQLYFLEGADIGDREVLADAAGACGMGRASVRAKLDTDLSRAFVLRQIAEANESGIDGVPCFIFNHTTYLPGAQRASVLVETMRQVLASA
jgi:predicted DsbA family dithiol-disulfide isomerase